MTKHNSTSNATTTGGRYKLHFVANRCGHSRITEYKLRAGITASLLRKCHATESSTTRTSGSKSSTQAAKVQQTRTVKMAGFSLLLAETWRTIMRLAP